ncbi:MAG TPA: MarR family transcriptional regulator [Streptosporangiaceae bacterium]
MDGRPASPPAGEEDFAYLLVQLGFHLARQFSERLAPLGLEPRHAGMLTRLAAHEGLSQQALGELIGLNPTRMVFLVDELEQRGLVERRRNTADRRSYALYLTPQGRDTLHRVQAAGDRHQHEIGASLSKAERLELASLLRRLAAEQGITEDSLPGIPPRPPLASTQPRADPPGRGAGPPG